MTTFDLSTVPEHDRERMAALIPDARIADAYIHREIWGVEDFDVLDAAMEERENVRLTGPTGSSKTTVFRAYAAARQLPFALVECNAAMDPGTVLGRTIIDPDGRPRWIDGDMTMVVRYGGVVLIDEIDMAHPRITAAFHQLLAVTRKLSLPEAGETIAAGRGGIGDPQLVLLAAAMNGREYHGTSRLNAALINRYAMPLPWGYERSVEEALLDSAELLNIAGRVRNLEEIRSPLSTNALMEFERHARRFGMHFATQLLVNRFEADEQAPVARAIEAVSDVIAKELGIEE